MQVIRHLACVSLLVDEGMCKKLGDFKMINTTDVLIIGGGFAGVSTAQKLVEKGIKTILVDKKDYFEVTFANLRNLTDPGKTQNRARKRYQDFLKSEFVQTSVEQLEDEQALLANGDVIKFKCAIIASGTNYPSMTVAKPQVALNLEQRNQEFASQNDALQAANSILVMGGGVVGVELAGEIAFSFPDKKVTLSHSGKALLEGFKPKAQRKAKEQLIQQGVTIEFNRKYQRQNEEYLDKVSGKVSKFDLVFEAIGVKPNNQFLQAHLSDALNAQGYVKVDDKFRVLGHKTLYALGDIAEVGEAKLGYLANQQGAHLAKVICAELVGKKAKLYKTNPLMALIPTGQESGIVQLPFAVTTANFLVNIKQKDLFINKIYKEFGTQPNTQ